MTRRALRSLATLAIVVSLAACAGLRSGAERAQRARIDALADAERAFAAAATTEGVNAAFVGVLADDATLFRPGPVDGKAFFAKLAPSRYRLEWTPQRVAVAASDELGFSTGPYRYTPDADPAAGSVGAFFTVWRRGVDGRWQVLIDHGAGDPLGSGWTRDFEPLIGDGSHATARIADAEATFAQTTATDGLAAAYAQSASPGIRLLRDDLAPVEGLQALATMPNADARWTWTMTDGAASRAGDLAWTMGRYRGRVAAGFFVRVWRAERGDWKIIGDVLAPLEETPR